MYLECGQCGQLERRLGACKIISNGLEFVHYWQFSFTCTGISPGNAVCQANQFYLFFFHKTGARFLSRFCVNEDYHVNLQKLIFSMLATAISEIPSTKKISWDTFRKKYLTREDKYKYEWVNGMVEKTPRSMDQSQLYVLTNLSEFLTRLKLANPRVNGHLIAEGDAFFAGNHRRPDIAYYTEAQIQAGRRLEKVNLEFVIEVISTNDQMIKVHEKMRDYRAANVKVIWQIFPKLREIHVYRGKNMSVCVGDDLCSAEPVVEGFILPAKDVFK